MLRAVAVLLHGLVVVGLIALLVRSVRSLRASFYYDPLFDGWSILFMAGGVALVIGILLAAGLWWYRSGRVRPLVAADVLVAGLLLLSVFARIAARGPSAVNSARLLPLAVALIALLAPWLVVRASPDQPMPSRHGPMW